MPTIDVFELFTTKLCKIVAQNLSSICKTVNGY